MTIIEKAKELGEMLSQSEEYKRMTEAEAKQKADPESITAFAQYDLTRNKLMEKARKEDITADEMNEIRNEMEQAYKTLMSNETVAEYIAATEGFTNLMNQINAAIAYYVAPKSECGGDCSGCSGCH